ncbi:MAG: pilus assembly protein PilP [Gammaproteobacteria bacterium]|nr:pilus assembly protein PilP [Gammaproteobacteria bacterium]MDP2139887.1 pilus assembly protein PilP [Gammaproteobacteria bacterium]MDP2347707.1 pilus assembly protein PilP [Gammaproteobacteria bacterium]
MPLPALHNGAIAGHIISLLKLTTISLLCLLQVACSRAGNMDDLQQYIIDVSIRPGGEVEPMPVFLPYEAFTYSAASMRSPFDVPVMAGTAAANEPVNQVQPNFDRVQEPLESFSLPSLNMVGMITRGNSYLALIRDESGMIHRVGIGNYLGRNHGRIIRVTATETEIIEIVPSGSGGWLERPQTLAMQR